MAELRRMISQTTADRAWFSEQARLTRNHGMAIDADVAQEIADRLNRAFSTEAHHA